jgi:hypothetical protein
MDSRANLKRLNTPDITDSIGMTILGEPVLFGAVEIHCL